MVRAEWPVRLLSPAIGRYNPFHPSFRKDPYRVYRRLQTDAPVYYSRALRGFVLSRHEHVARVLADPRMICDRRQSKVAQDFAVFDSMRPDFAQAVVRSLLMLDAPDHTRLRRLVSRAFTPRVVERLSDGIAARVSALLDAMERKPDPDVIRDLADPLPLAVIADLLGIPEEDRAHLKAWSNDFVGLLDPIQSEADPAGMERAFDELRAVMHRVFAARRREPREDLVSGLVQAGEQGDVLSEAELDSLCVLLLVAGNETTTNLIGNGTLALLQHPAQRRILLDGPEAARRAVEELLRYDGPIQATDRVASEDLEIEGRPVKKGEIVALLLGAANRDPAVFARPDELDLTRADNPHLAFGHGVHFCLGAQLARLEGRHALVALFERYPELAANGAAGPWKRSIVLRGLSSLPVRLTGRARVAA
ncbi:cytochrome P450 [Candidatus Binatia bacterium]|nr:cytochrome P450 [Candidatus Binatia bacterium]